MNIVTNLPEWQAIRRSLSGSIGFVPTMGHLHEGHASLCRRARAENDIVVVSVYVNPTQFNQTSDFEQYHRTLEADCKLLEALGVDYVLCPPQEEMYADGYEVRVTETSACLELEGEFRPGHFTGMMTVVMKLLSLAQATRAYFGEKDFQQLMLVKKMVSALFLPVEIVACETVRAESGLALSSRNSRLTEEQRAKASLLYRLLISPMSDAEVLRRLEEEGFKPEYAVTKWGRRLAAVWLDKTRLIDNVPYHIEEKKNAACA